MNREEFVQSQLGRGGPECDALRLAIAEERHLFNPLTQNNTDLAMAVVAALVERLRKASKGRIASERSTTEDR